MKRTCNGCTACCTVMSVPSLAKRSGVPCLNCIGAGCSIYDTKPEECNVFLCTWLDDDQGLLTRPEDKPDNSGIVLVLPDFDQMLAAREYGAPIIKAFEVWPGAFGSYWGSKLLKRISRRMIVVMFLANGSYDRCVLGPPNARVDAVLLEAIKNAAEDELGQKNWQHHR